MSKTDIDGKFARHAATGIALVALAALSGCGGISMSTITNPWGGPVEQSRLPVDAAAYRCDGGKPLYVRYGPGNQFAMVLFPDREFRLDAVDGSSGARFTNGRTNLEVGGAEVKITEGTATLYANCKRPEPAAAPAM